MNNGILTSGYAPPLMPGGLLGSPTAVEMIDAYGYNADARRYIRAVEAADGQPLELAVRVAINEFVVGCKNDGIWDAIRASCILCGARTLAGALVPLAGPAPTNFNFVSGDYSRRLGLVGNGSTKYLRPNRRNNADLRNDKHVAMYATARGSTNDNVWASANWAGNTGETAFGFFGSTAYATLHRASWSAIATGVTAASVPPATMFGVSRSEPSGWTLRIGGRNVTMLGASEPPSIGELILYCNSLQQSFITARVAFYSIGQSLNLLSLESRIVNLLSAIGAAIP